MKDRPVRECQVCGCTDADCSGCVERLGEPCEWVDSRPLNISRSKGQLCTACQPLLEANINCIPTPVRPLDAFLLARNRAHAAGVHTIGAVIELNSCKAPRPMTGDDVTVLILEARSWLHEMVTVGPMGATVEQQEACAS